MQRKFVKKAKRAVFAQAPSTTRVIHNFQHDLESLWWILPWTVTCRIDSDAAFAYGRPIFVNQTDPSEARRNCFIAESILGELETFLPLQKTEEEVTFAEIIDSLRDLMNDHYTEGVAKDDQYKTE